MTGLGHTCRRISRNAGLLNVRLAVVLMLTSPFVLRGGLAHPEAYTFIPHHLGDGLIHFFRPRQFLRAGEPVPAP